MLLFRPPCTPSKVVPTIASQSVKGAEEEALKKQLEESQSVINELQNKIQKLAIENTELKSRIKSQNVGEDEVIEL